MVDTLRRYVTTSLWSYQSNGTFDALYHCFNLAEALVWFAFAAMVSVRYLRHRRSWVELVYAAAFVAFGLSDLREAYHLQPWLIALKAANLAVLLGLRRLVMRRWYPESRKF